MLALRREPIIDPMVFGAAYIFSCENLARFIGIEDFHCLRRAEIAGYFPAVQLKSLVSRSGGAIAGQIPGSSAVEPYQNVVEIDRALPLDIVRFYVTYDVHGLSAKFPHGIHNVDNV